MSNTISLKKYIKITALYFVLSVCGCMMLKYRYLTGGKYVFNFLAWNLFLAWVPYGLSTVSCLVYFSKLKQPHKGVALLCVGLIWLAFYPNAPYILTDFIHFCNFDFYNLELTKEVFAMWYDFIMFSLFILTGVILGLISLYQMQAIVQDYFNKAAGWFFSIIVLFLSSYAIYLGRFVRLNSWDIVYDLKGLILVVVNSVNDYTILFTVLLGIFEILIYCGFYSLIDLKTNKKKS